MILRSRFVHCVPARTNPVAVRVAVHSRSSLRPGTSPPRSPRCSAPGTPRSTAEGHRERISAGAWAISFDAGILVQETPLWSTSRTRPRPSPKARLSPALMADLSSTSTHLYAAPQDVVMTSILHDLVRGPAPSIGERLCKILDMEFPEFTFSTHFVNKGERKGRGC